MAEIPAVSADADARRTASTAAASRHIALRDAIAENDSLFELNV